MDENTDLDQLFKTLIREFFPLFFADLAARFELSAVKWLDKELFANPPDGPPHVFDLVAEMTTLGGDATTLTGSRRGRIGRLRDRRRSACCL